MSEPEHCPNCWDRFLEGNGPATCSVCGLSGCGKCVEDGSCDDCYDGVTPENATLKAEVERPKAENAELREALQDLVYEADCTHKSTHVMLGHNQFDEARAVLAKTNGAQS